MRKNMEDQERLKQEQKKLTETKARSIVHIEDSNQFQESEIIDIPSEDFVDETIQEREAI